MRTCATIASVLALVAPVALEGQDPGRTRWSISGGPSYLISGPSFTTNAADRFTYSMQDTVVVISGTDNVGHVALGVAKPIARSALVARAELLYNRNEGKPLEYTWMPNARRALSEDDFLLSAGLQWDARPLGRWSPYLLTTAGVRNTRIGWARNSSATSPDQHRWFWGPLLSLGAGMRATVGKREYFAEWRATYDGNVQGASLMPVSVGIRF